MCLIFHQPGISLLKECCRDVLTVNIKLCDVLVLISNPMVWQTPQEATTVWKTQVLDGAADIYDHSPGTVKVFLSNVDFGINTSRGYGRLR